MWTPRRILLLLAALFGLAAVYFAYSRALGGVDGLPELPARYLDRGGDQPALADPAGKSPTIARLIRAFGPKSLEAADGVSYKLRTEVRDKGFVLACGQPKFDNSPIVTVEPFSIAFFGKPDLRAAPGEVEEISTMHSDRARLEWDRPVNSPQDMGNAKLIAMTLESTPGAVTGDSRTGIVEITDNQKSTSSADFLVFRTPGPVYYRDPDAGNPAGAPADADVAQVSTPADVEVVDRRNLPRGLRSTQSATRSRGGDALREPGAVADILTGRALPPPTITATGMKIYLQKTPKQQPGGPPVKRNAIGYASVRRIELAERVQFNLWTDGATGFPGSSPPPAVGAAKPVKRDDPPAGLAAVAGVGVDAARVAEVAAGKTLVVIETFGGFRYDFGAGLAQFDTAANADNVANYVAVARLPAVGSPDDMFCDKLAIELANTPVAPSVPGSPSSDRARQSPSPNGGVLQPATPPGTGPRIKRLTATSAGERAVVVNVQADDLSAQGTKLVYSTDPATRTATTTLTGAPVTAQKQQNRLTGGAAGVPVDIVIKTIDPAPTELNGRKTTSIAVNGPGDAALYDSESRDTNVRAAWKKSLTQDRVTENGVDLDVLKFDGGAQFVDVRADMTLGADRLTLWLAGRVQNKSNAPRLPGQQGAKPTRLDADGHVTSKSPELVIRDTNQLQLFFKDVDAPTPPKPAAAPAVAAAAAVAAVQPVVALVQPPPIPGVPDPSAPARPDSTAPVSPRVTPPVVAATDPTKPKPKPPVVLSARAIEATLGRYPVTRETAAKTPPANAGLLPAPRPSAGTRVVHELDRAVCVGDVVAHQDPADPAKAVRGLDISGDRLTLKGERVNGETLQAMTVLGTPKADAQVHFEAMTLIGPNVLIDQPRNVVAVDGVGSLLMPAREDPSGNPTAKQYEMAIDWKTRMRFDGALANAEFLGSAHAVQRPARAGMFPPPPPPAPGAKPVADDGTTTISHVYCHRLDATFDRPVYFNQLRRDPTPGSAQQVQKPREPSPRLKSAEAVPMPDDERAKLPPDAKVPDKVTYTDEQYADGPPGARPPLLKAQRVVAQELKIAVGDRRQDLLASGGGEVRILQPDAGGGFGQPAPPPQPAVAGVKPLTPYKLTLAKFSDRMAGVDKAKLFQQASFADGARVWQIPTDNINLNFQDHTAPQGTTFLSSDTSFDVSSSRTAPTAPPEQRMKAVGNAQFYDAKYEGNATTIDYDGRAVVFTGNENRPATFVQRVNPTGALPTRAGVITYFRDGRIIADRILGGQFGN